MNEPHTHSSSPWAFLGWASLIAAMAAGSWWLREDARTRDEALRNAYASEISTLKEQLAQCATATSSAPSAEMQTTLSAVHAELKTIATRLEALETKANQVITPAEATTSSSTTPAQDTWNVLVKDALSGRPYRTALDAWASTATPTNETLTTLRRFADQGLPSELSLRAVFDAQLAKTAQPTQEKKLGGLITIAKRDATQDSFSTLRGLPLDIPVNQIVEKLRALPPSEQASFTEWIETASAREAVLQRLQHP